MAPKSPWKKTTNNQNAKKSTPADQNGLPTINYGEVQDEELEVLQAIYMEDFEEVETKSAWSKTTDRSFKLKLRAFSDETSLVTLSVTLTASYPKSAPVLDLSGLERYHERTQKRFQNVIKNRPKQLAGEVMIHSIASEIQDALEDAVQARQQGALPSLEDERANAEEAATALAKEAEEAEARKAREAQEEEDRVLKQMVDEELSRRDKRKSMKTVATPTTPAPAANAIESISFDQQALVPVGNENLPFNTVELLNVIAQRRDALVRIGQPQVEGPIAAPLVTIKRINVHRSRDEIMDIESMLEQVSKLRNDNILDLFAYRVDRVDDLTTQLITCDQYADRGSLQELLDLGSLHVNKARQFTTQLLEGLDFLHRNGVVHGYLSCKSIFIVGRPAVSLRLAEFGYVWMTSTNDSGVPAKWQPPEGTSISNALKRKSDVWNLGIVILQMFLGLQITADHQSPQSMLSRLDFSDAFDDLARKLFVADVKKRPSAFDLLPTEFLRTDAPVLDEDTLAVPGQAMQGFGPLGPGARRSRHNSSGGMEPTSRYTTDFTEIGRLGRGGFGEVVKARNKLDGGVYAVKKIKQAPQLLDQVLSEVMLLNRLNHPYVVRYFSTWVENDLSGTVSEETMSTTDYTGQTGETGETEEESSDGPRIDFGYQSTGGLDFVSSTGFPQIQFGDDDSDDDPFERDEEDSDGKNLISSEIATDSRSTQEFKLGHRARKSRSESKRLPSVLYIQMEYCERQTLRDLVRRGMSTDDSWRYVRQVTEGLSHVHGHGIIHRDLKPDNIFIDVAGNPKIGDFGLATTGQYHVSERTPVPPSGQSYGDMTRSVGTALYVAPELRSSSGGSYNDKVDMYSLGVMFFEMCEEFSTAMERIRALQSIRERDHELPPAFRLNGEKAAQGKLISCLISHKPSERPSSTELLRSDILPVKIEDETIRQALSGLSDSRSPYHQKMMSALFAHDTMSSGRVKALAWDAKGPTGAEDAIKLRLRGVARHTLEDIFRRHGAEETRRESIFPRSGYYTNANVVQLLDASGNLLQLPYDLTLPHARHLARQSPAVKRTYVFGSAYRDTFTGGPPRVSDEVDFDIVYSGTDDERSFDDAEVLKVMDEIACEMPVFANSTAISFHVNHVGVLDAILEFCRVPVTQQPAVKEVLSRLGFHQWNWAKVRAELRKFGLPDTALEDLQQFDFRDSPEKVVLRLRHLFDGASSRIKLKFDSGIQSLVEMLRAGSQLSIQRKVFFAPLASVNAKFYEGGMLFQCVLDRKSNRTAIAAGGRYDSLIQAHRPVDAQASCQGAVGVSIGLDPIIAYMAKNTGEGSKTSFLKDPTKNNERSKRCHVLVVASGTEGARAAGIKILTSLWTNDISAEMTPSTRAIGDEAEHNFVVTVRHEASNTVRVAATAADGEESDVPVTSLVSHLQHEIRELQGTKSRAPAFVRQASQQDTERARGNVQVLMAQHRSKKSNKYHIVDAAQQRWSDKIDEWRDAPILAVETRDDVLELLRETRLGDPETWRRASQSVQLNERQYVQQVQDILSSWRKKWSEGEGGREACLFNFRTGYCTYYDVGL